MEYLKDNNSTSKSNPNHLELFVQKIFVQFSKIKVKYLSFLKNLSNRTHFKEKHINTISNNF